MTKPPPFTINSQIVNLIAKISEQVGGLNASLLNSSPYLRKKNRIKTIAATLAIEGNNLTISGSNDHDALAARRAGGRVVVAAAVGDLGLGGSSEREGAVARARSSGGTRCARGPHVASGACRADVTRGAGCPCDTRRAIARIRGLRTG